MARSHRLAEIGRLLADILTRKDAADEARTLRQEALAAYTRVRSLEHSLAKALSAKLN